MEEIWKDVIGFEGLYQVSNFGRVRSLDRRARIGYGKTRFVKGKYLTPCACTNGYLSIPLHNGSENKKVFLMHRLVAMHFIPNSDNLPEVNHKDEDITNNRADNLEWCTSKYNANYGARNRKVLETKFARGLINPVNQYTKDGKFVRRWESMADAGREYGVDISAIIRVCRGKQHTSMGYVWEYA